MGSLKKQIETYEAMKDDLELDYFGKWVVLHDEKLVGSYDSFDEAASDAIEKFGYRGPYLIRQVGAPPLRLPASVMYRPLYAKS